MYKYIYLPNMANPNQNLMVFDCSNFSTFCEQNLFSNAVCELGKCFPISRGRIKFASLCVNTAQLEFQNNSNLLVFFLKNLMF